MLRMRHLRLMFFLVILICLFLTLKLVILSLSQSQSLSHLSWNSEEEADQLSTSQCVLPNVDPFRVDIMKLIRKLPPIRCNGKKRYGTVVGQELRLDVNGLRKAEMKYIRRPAGDDFKVEFSEAISIDLTRTGRVTSRYCRTFSHRLASFHVQNHCHFFIKFSPEHRYIYIGSSRHKYFLKTVKLIECFVRFCTVV